MLLQSNPYLSHADRTRLQSLGTLVSVLASTEQTDGALNIFDVICPAGFSTPLHIHHAEDVAIHVLEGALTIFWQEAKEENVGIGAHLFQPCGTAHGFSVRGNAPARILYITTPGGFDQYVLECTLATSSSAAIAAVRYQIEILSPPPGKKKRPSTFSSFRAQDNDPFLSRIFLS